MNTVTNQNTFHNKTVNCSLCVVCYLPERFAPVPSAQASKRAVRQDGKTLFLPILCKEPDLGEVIRLKLEPNLDDESK